MDVHGGCGLRTEHGETAQAQKVGVVDLQAVLDQSVNGRSAKDRLRIWAISYSKKSRRSLSLSARKKKRYRNCKPSFAPRRTY